MSTPSAKPFSPFDLSPYAPKKARMQAAAQHAAENDTEAGVRLPLEGVSEPPAVDEAQDDAAQAAASATPEATADEPAEPSPAPETADPDMERIENSLRWLQREGGSRRLPRAVQLPPIAGLRSVGNDARSRDDQFINGIRVPHSLAPERLRPPPEMRERRDYLRGPLRVLVACLIAAPIAYYFSAGSFTLSSPSRHETQPEAQAEAPRETQLASIATKVVTARQFPLPKEDLRPSEADDYNSMLASVNRAVPQPLPAEHPAVPALDVPAAAPAPAAPPAAALAEPEPAAPPKPVVLASRELAPEEIRLLLQKGEQYVAAGDLVTARQVYRRAADAGNAAAALAMGATFDPTVLAKLGTFGMIADTAKAREWYEKAKSFGSPDAARRLELLATAR